MSLSEPFTRSVDVDEGSDYHPLSNNRNKSASGASSFVDALWGSTARKIVTIVTAVVIVLLLGMVVYYAAHDAKIIPPPEVHSSSSSTGNAHHTSSSSSAAVSPYSSSSMSSIPLPPTPSSTGAPAPFPSTAAPYVPAETEMLRRLAAELDASRDVSADPCHDWYQYACGGWVRSTPLVGNQTMNTKGFSEARDDNQKYIAQILNADWPIVTPMYQSCMDVDSIHSAGLSPIRPLMSLLAPNSSAIRSHASLYYVMGELRYRMRLNALVVAAQSANNSNPRQPLLQLGWGGFTIAGQNAWMSYVGPNATRVLPRLIDGISAMFQVVDGAGSKADSEHYARLVVEFETALINITSRAAIADYYRRRPSLHVTIDEAVAAEHQLGAENGMYSYSEIRQLAPSVDFESFFNGSQLLPLWRNANVTAAYLPDNASFPLVDALVAATPLDVLLAYTRWRALNHSMPYLDYDVRALHHSYFHQFAPVTSYDEGQSASDVALPNNYAYCSQLVVYNLDDLFGRYFVSLRLQPEKADVARNLITWIRQAFERNLPSIAWMDDATRAVALDKANAVLELVGGPENGVWADYSRVTITRDQFFENWVQIQRMRVEDEWKQLTRPISRAKFTMNPSLVNAQYSPRANAMTFPAAILQEVSHARALHRW